MPARSPGAQSVNAGADCFDAADAFVPEGEGREGEFLEACDEEIGVAESTGFHAEEDFAGGGFGEVERFDGDGSSGVGQDGCSGVGAAHAEEYNENRWKERGGGFVFARGPEFDAETRKR